jgi:hypothetical protein
MGNKISLSLSLSHTHTHTHTHTQSGKNGVKIQDQVFFTFIPVEDRDFGKESGVREGNG